MKPLALIVALGLTLAAGCVANPDTGRAELTEGGKAALREVAAIGISRYVRETSNPERIERIRSTLADLQALPDITTVDGLRAVVQARIDGLSDPYDRQDFTHLLNILAPLLSDYVGSGQLAPEAVVRVRDFLAYLAAALPLPPV